MGWVLVRGYHGSLVPPGEGKEPYSLPSPMAGYSFQTGQIPIEGEDQCPQNAVAIAT